jgi:PAS domain S-box-containing protein
MTPPTLTQTLRDTLSLFEGGGPPLTTTEVAERVDLGRRSAYERLERLVEHGKLETKKVGSGGRVWWRPDDGSPGDEQFKSLVDGVEEYAIFRLGPDGRVRTWNAGAERIKGYDAGSILGSDVATFYTPEERAEGVPERNLAAAADRGTVEDQGWRVRADGSRFWANVTITAIRDADGELEGYAKVTRDMSERREREQRLRRERDLTWQLFETAPARLAVFTPDGSLDRLNSRARRAFGVEDGGTFDLADQQFYDADGEPLPVEDHPFRTIAETGAPVTGRLVGHETAEAGLRWVRVSGAPLFDESGAIERIVVAGEDVTELQRAKRELEHELTEVFARIDDAFFAIDEAWQFVHVNEQAASLLDHAVEDLRGRNIWDMFSEAVGTTFQRQYERALETQESVTFEEYYPPLGTWFEVSAHPSESGLSVYFRDVTERREREQELERRREQLAALNSINEVVREITAATIDQSTRAAIEQTVCSYLADSDSYLFAWVGEVDVPGEVVTVRTQAGVEGYLDGVDISVDPDDEHGLGPTGRAFRTGEVQTMTEVGSDPSYEPWRDRFEAYGFASSAAIPISHGGTTYGTLNVYSGRPNAFTGQERRVIGQLGEIVGHAIAATARKQALLSDDVTELHLHVPDMFGAFDVSDQPPGTARLHHAVSLDDDAFVVYGSADSDTVDWLRTLVGRVPHWESVTVRDGPRDESAFELRLSAAPTLSAIASAGGSIERATIDDGDYRLTVHVPADLDTRTVIDRVESDYPNVTLRKRRQLTAAADSAERARQGLLSALTDRQRTAVETAYHAGFFEWPRTASGEEVAASLDIAATTFHHHLRKAERKVFEEVFDAGVTEA